MKSNVKSAVEAFERWQRESPHVQTAAPAANHANPKASGKTLKN